MGLEDLAEPDLSFDRLARVLQHSIGAPVGLISIVEPERQVFPGAAGLRPAIMAERQTPISHSFCQYVVRDRAPVVITDAREDARLRDNPAIVELDVVAYAGVPLCDAHGDVIGSVCAIDHEPREWNPGDLRVLDDIAEVATAEFRLRSSAAALSRSYEQLTMFAGQVSHDLKSPLGAILGFLELVDEGISDADNARVRGYMERCRSSAHRMSRTIDELLAYATVGGALDIHALSLDAVMAAVMDDLDPAADADVSWSDATIHADPVQLRCLLQNLVGNALKFRHRDRPPVVSVTATSFATLVELRVVDNGSGIPADRRGEVLRPMVRLRRDVPGSGLGLATCDRIATAHGGVIQISATPGGGTTVAVQLPVLTATSKPERLVAIA